MVFADYAAEYLPAPHRLTAPDRGKVILAAGTLCTQAVPRFLARGSVAGQRSGMAPAVTAAPITGRIAWRPWFRSGSPSRAYIFGGHPTAGSRLHRASLPCPARATLATCRPISTPTMWVILWELFRGGPAVLCLVSITGNKASPVRRPRRTGLEGA